MIEYFARKKNVGALNTDFAGVWRNELNSEMELTVAGTSVTGKYRTGVGLPTPAEEFDLVGFISDDQISFTVNFGRYGSLTSWVGQQTRESGTGIIKTLWLLSRNVADDDEPTKLWGSVLAGADDFRRITP
jgi:hypothetical protein